MPISHSIFRGNYLENTETIYQRHLPPGLYDYLNQHGLLNSEEHKFTAKEETTDRDYEIKFTAKREISDTNAEMLELEVIYANHPGIRSLHYLFSQRLWKNSAIIENDGTDYIGEVDEAKPLAHQQSETLEVADGLIELLKQIIPPVYIARISP